MTFRTTHRKIDGGSWLHSDVASASCRGFSPRWAATVLWLLLLERQSVGPQWSDFYYGSWKKDLLRVIGHIWSLSTGPI